LGQNYLKTISGLHLHELQCAYIFVTGEKVALELFVHRG